ncbi:VWA domain-containing protein [Amycolatopsis cynarae]|uniref:VWA domain-containing protein n=1 Tax=Amycolatopsis cynarae TaxID=2995223 RepID=A0ABY7BD27_9PSEU|nr:vWA domain-containing protein [Amycolatopsis sp. HUAS 11-8]WAL69528.1 VWA domain-containing protein [Amycolatopsis sp. HUAS 11-8]
MGVLDEDAFAKLLREEPDLAVTMLVEMGSATDERLRAAARALARRMMLDVARRGVARGRGIGRLRRLPARHGGELDLDASLPALLEARAAGRPPHLDDLIARDWARPELALCLVIDASGSMTGARLAAAALTAAACAWRAPAEHAIVSFARRADVLRPLCSVRPPGAVVDTILALRGHGVTALATALRTAREQLAPSRAARKAVVLLSDCRATDDEDPVPAARACPELLILAPGDDHDEAAHLASRAGARWLPLTGAAGAPAALAALLDGTTGRDHP